MNLALISYSLNHSDIKHMVLTKNGPNRIVGIISVIVVHVAVAIHIEDIVSVGRIRT